MKDTVYCSFSFRRLKKFPGEGIFAVAFYFDEECKKVTAKETRKIPLWENQQFVCAVQSYNNALYYIHKWQGIMLSKGIKNVILMTDNSTLAGWIENPKKNKFFVDWMQKAVDGYRVGQINEIKMNVGLHEVVNLDKAYKYCREDLIVEEPSSIIKEDNKNVVKLDTSSEYITLSNLVEEDNNEEID